METKHYELRKLSSKDIFPLSKIISKIGIKEFSTAFQNVDLNNDNATAVGVTVFMDMAAIVLENLSSCEKELYSFFADVSGTSVKELQDISLADFMQLIVDVVQKEEFVDFFKVVSRLLTTEK